MRALVGPTPRISMLVNERGAQQPRKVVIIMSDILNTRLCRSRRSLCRRTARLRAIMADTEAWTPIVGGMFVAAPISEVTSGAVEDRAGGEVAVGVGEEMRGGWLSCLVPSAVHCSLPTSQPLFNLTPFFFFCFL